MCVEAVSLIEIVPCCLVLTRRQEAKYSEAWDFALWTCVAEICVFHDVCKGSETVSSCLSDRR